MTKAWITMGSTTVESIVNPINAACAQGYVPETIRILDNPNISREVDRAIDIASTIVSSYNEAEGNPGEPEIDITTLESETEFDNIRQFVQDSIEAYQTEGDEVAVDITPGRKFMSAITFAAGMKYGADHVFYFYISSPAHHGKLYPTMPETATKLYDFREVM